MVKRLRPARWPGLLLGLALVAAACGGGDGGGDGGDGGDGGGRSSSHIREGGTLRYAADREPTGYNPSTSKDHGTAALWVVNRVYPSVFHARPDSSLALDDDLMESAELTSQDPQTIVYRISPKASWSDGTPIGADDFVYCWQSQNGRDRHLDVASTTGYEDIQSVTGSDNDKTVTVVFKRRFGDWRSLFGQMVPARYARAQPGGWNTGFDSSPEKIPSGGPFKIQSYAPGRSLTLARNERYWGSPAHLDKIVYRFLPEPGDRLSALERDEVDLIYPQPRLDQVRRVRRLPDVRYQINLGLSFEHFDFNFRDPRLGDLRVRQAIATGIDRRELLDRTVGQLSSKATVLGNRVYLTGQKQYQDHAGAFGTGDVAAARKLLEDDGYTPGPDGIYQKAGRKLSFRFSTTAGNALRETLGVLFRAQMKPVGIDIRIANAPSAKLFGDWLPRGDFDVACFAWVGTPFAVTGSRPLYTSGGGSNYGRYASPRVDRLFDQAAAELDPAKAAAVANRADQVLWDDMATIPLFQEPTFLAWRSTFTNIADNATGEGPLVDAPHWALKA